MWFVLNYQGNEYDCEGAELVLFAMAVLSELMLTDETLPSANKMLPDFW